MSVKERGFAHVIKDLGGNKRSWESAPPWVSDGSKYVPYIYSRDDAKKCYRVQVGLIGAVIYDTGVTELYDPELKEIRVKGEEWELWQGTKKATLNTPIKWGVVEDKTGVHVTREQSTSKPNGNLKIVYSFIIGKGLKHTVTWVSTETKSVSVQVKQIHLMDFDKVATDTGTSLSSKSEKSTSYKFSYGAKDVWVIENQHAMVYDTKAAEPNTLLTEKCLQSGDIDVAGKKATYTFGDWTLTTGESLEIDPDTSTLNNPTEDGHIKNGSVRTNASDLIRTGYRTGDIYRSYVEWNITAISDTATITNTVFKYHGKLNQRDCHIHAISGQPSVATTANLYADIADGTVYADVAGFPVVNTNQEIDLGATADSDLQTSLSVDWFAIGIQSDSEATDALSDIYSENKDVVDPTPPPTLYVEYTVPAAASNPQGSGVVNTMLALLSKMVE